MIILGIHFDGHDSGAAIIVNGVVKAVVNEERISRKKEDDSFPFLSIQECLTIANISEKDVDKIAFSGYEFGIKKILMYGQEIYKRMLFSKGYYLFNRPNPSFINPLSWLKYLVGTIKTTIPNELGITAMIEGIGRVSNAKKLIRIFKDKGFLGKIEFVPHQLAHLYDAYYYSNYNKCLIFNIEGSSFEFSTNIAVGENGKVKELFSIPVEYSLGRFYATVTKILGFKARRHAGKITGLAAYGDSSIAYDVVKKLVWVENDFEIKCHPNMDIIRVKYEQNNRKIPKELSDFSKEDIAAAFQRRLEEIVCEIVDNAAKKYKIHNISLAGGVCANVKMNQKIYNLDSVESVYIHPGMGDVGQALGAATYSVIKSNNSIKPLDNVFLGADYSDEHILEIIKKYNDKVEYKESSNIAKDVAMLLSENNIVAHFHGKMEYGPRSLGNRSILVSASDKEINDKLNKMMNRTEFMPFAPMVIKEHAPKLFTKFKGIEFTAEFMTITLDCTEYMADNYKAVVHVDNTARPQFVTKENNHRVYNILQEYYKLTNLSAIVNTSFNMHEEPIVMTPEDAIKSFLNAGFDYLILEKYILKIR